MTAPVSAKGRPSSRAAGATSALECGDLPNADSCEFTVVGPDLEVVKTLNGSVCADGTQLVAGVPVVFVTGFADFALPAFDLGAVDYLLKPVSLDRLGRTLARIAGRSHRASAVDRLCLRAGSDRLLLPLSGLLYLRRDDGVTTVALDHETLRVRDTLQRLEAVLSGHGFLRCHRAYLVNLRRVRRIVPWSQDAQSLLLDDPKETLIPLAKSRIQELRLRLLWP